MFLSVIPSNANLLLVLDEGGPYLLGYGSRSSGVSMILRQGTFRFSDHGDYLTLMADSQLDIVMRIAHDDGGPLLYLQKGGLGTKDPSVRLPLSLDGRDPSRP